MKRYIKATIAKLSDEPIDIKLEVLADPNITPDMLTDLSESNSDFEDWKVRYAIASNPNTPAAVLDKLATDEVDLIRRNVASNPNTSEATLLKLTNDSYLAVLCAALQNPNCTSNILNLLISNGDELLRRRIATNTQDIDILSILVDDENADVRYEVAINPHTTSELLHKLVSDSDRFVRREVASSQNTSEEDLAYLSEDPDRDVRWNIADNENTPIQVLQTLIADKSPYVRKAAKHQFEGRI